MEMTIRPMEGPEQHYSYAQCPDISSRAGLIGHLRADMDTDGNGFFSSFFNFRSELKSDDFKEEFQEMIDALREDSFLTNRSALKKYCNQHPECALGDGREFGLRADTEHYSYMLRLNPNKGDYNLYCYCYVRQWLEQHMRQAERGIRFITPEYQDLFRIDDGDQIRITRSDGVQNIRTCRYIDDTHFEIGDAVMHICEFAEKMEASNAQEVIPLRNSLPEKCYSVLESTGQLIEIIKGEKGYTPTIVQGNLEGMRKAVDKANRNMGVTRPQEEAMIAGAMFGWQVPGADPKNYDENGSPIRPQNRNRGEAR